MRIVIFLLIAASVAYSSILVDFGSEEAENYFEYPDWNTILLGENVGYYQEGPGGVGAFTFGDLIHFMGIQGSSLCFNAGDEIVVTFYNNSDEKIKDWYPLISFQDSNNPVNESDEPQWFVMHNRSGDCNLEIASKETQKIYYTFTSEETAIGTPKIETAGSHSIVNICPNSPNGVIGLICDKIEFFRKEDITPDKPENLQVIIENNNLLEAKLTWEKPEGEYDNFRIYRNDLYIGNTTETSYSDYMIEYGKEYNYYIQANRNKEVYSEKSDIVTVQAPGFSLSSNLLNPETDFEYLGAFRFPEESSAISYTGRLCSWDNRKGAITYYPYGDQTNIDGDQIFPGSLYASGHYITFGMIAEISIPEPVISKNFDDLPKAHLLNDFRDVRPQRMPPSGQIGIKGTVALHYLESENIIFTTFSDDHQQNNKIVSHGAFNLFESGNPEQNLNSEGCWFIGDSTDIYYPHYYSYAFCLHEIPASWAATNGLDGKTLLSSGKRTGGPKGPGLVAVKAWSDDNLPLASGAELPFKLLLYYDEKEMNNNNNQDFWRGVCWLDNGEKEGVIIAGQKAYGDYLYCYEDGSPTAEIVYSVPRIPTSSQKGGQIETHEPILLFYNPADLAKVCNQDLLPDEPQPYAILNLRPYLLRDESTYFKQKLNSEICLRYITYDKERNYLFVEENNITDKLDAVHVFKISTPLSNNEPNLNEQKSFNLRCYPNPFNPVTTISFSLENRSTILLQIYNLKGQLIKTLVDKKLDKGNYSYRFEAKELNSGLYFYKFQNDNLKIIKKAVLVK